VKVLHIYKDYYPPVVGGIERHINLLVNGLAGRGVAVEVLVSNTGINLERENVNGINVTKAPQLGRFASAPLNVTFPFLLRRLGRRADILHFHFPNPTGEFSYLVSGLRSKVVVSYHSDIVRQANLLKVYSPFLIRFLDRADVILASSPEYVRSSPVLNRFRHKCKVVPYGHRLTVQGVTDGTIEKSAAIRRTYGPAVLLFIGKFRNYKGLHILIEAMKATEAKLLLIGSGPLEVELRRHVVEAGVGKKTFFLGELPDSEMVDYLQACDMLILPSNLRSEAFGLVQLEAMACGKPVVSTELGTGTSFANVHEETGLVIPPNDAGALTCAVNYLIENPGIRQKYGLAGMERVKKLFSVERMIDSVLSVYREMLVTNGRSTTLKTTCLSDSR
jgi:glycosyltransferase involved in cell wall biosynthesis